MNFELQFWVMQEGNGVRVKSEVSLAIMQSFEQAGIEIPYPQRDLRLRSIDPSAAAMLAEPNGVKNTPAESNRGSAGDKPGGEEQANRKTAGKW